MSIVSAPGSTTNSYKLNLISLHRIVLTNSGKLFQVCPIMSMFFPCFQSIDFLVEDLVVMGINNNGLTEISILTKPNPENSKQYIKVLEYPCKLLLRMFIINESSSLFSLQMQLGTGS